MLPPYGFKLGKLGHSGPLSKFGKKDSVEIHFMQAYEKNPCRGIWKSIEVYI